jgi:hypothetical protein
MTSNFTYAEARSMAGIAEFSLLLFPILKKIHEAE